MKTTKIITPDTIARAKRARSARKFAGLTMEQLNIQHNIPPSTLQGWENTGCTSLKNRSLTLKGAQRLVFALKNEGVFCSIEWLMEGKGPGPSFTSPLMQDKSDCHYDSQHSSWTQDICLQNEIKAFEQNNPNPIVVLMPDDALSPLYDKGDIIGGIKYFFNDIARCVEHTCIIETNKSEVFVRKLQAGHNAHLYTLVPHNSNTKSCDPIIKDVALKWVAPILWHRRIFYSKV